MQITSLNISRQAIQPTDWVVSPQEVESIVTKMKPLRLPTPRPTRIVLSLPVVPPDYLRIPSFARRYHRLYEQTHAYAVHLGMVYETNVPVLVMTH